MRAPVDVRFDHSFIPEPMSGCWLWTGSLSTMGYGRIKVAGRFLRAHRLSYEMSKGPIPEGLLIRHTCDNPVCVNPDHLLVGTKKDNADDMVRRNRSHRFNGARAGAGNPNAKLSLEDIAAIRQLRSSGAPYQTIADMYGVGRQTIGDIFLGKSWKP